MNNTTARSDPVRAMRSDPRQVPESPSEPGRNFFVGRTFWIILVLIFWVLVVIGVMGAYLFNWTWTGFQDNGTLWDWMSLLVTPILVTVLPLVLQYRQNEPRHAEPLPPVVLNHAADRQETLLATYMERLSELLLKNNLSATQAGSDTHTVAQAWTLSILRRLDQHHKGTVLQFLYTAGLITAGKAVISLHGANLCDVDLSKAKLPSIDLNGADLSNANLADAKLTSANLADADLRGADLRGADLRGASLEGADLHGAMMDGTILDATPRLE